MLPLDYIHHATSASTNSALYLEKAGKDLNGKIVPADVLLLTVKWTLPIWFKLSNLFKFDLDSWTGASEGFFSGGAQGDFSKNFLGEDKRVNFVFSHSNVRKQPFLLQFSKSRGLAPIPMPMRLEIIYLIPVYSIVNGAVLFARILKFLPK